MSLTHLLSMLIIISVCVCVYVCVVCVCVYLITHLQYTINYLLQRFISRGWEAEHGKVPLNKKTLQILYCQRTVHINCHVLVSRFVFNVFDVKQTHDLQAALQIVSPSSLASSSFSKITLFYILVN